MRTSGTDIGAVGSLDALKRCLEALLEEYGPRNLQSDPVWFVHRYEDPADVEVAGFVAAALAYGRVSQIRRSFEFVFGMMGKSPARFVVEIDPGRECRRFEGFVHRFTRGKDLVALFCILGNMVRESGTIENFATGGWDPGEGVRGLLESLSRRALSMDLIDLYPGGKIPAGAGVRFFFPSPASGSACKRLNMFLRWMVRGPDGVDLGIWRNPKPYQLVVPMDTHMARISRFLGLTASRSCSWKTAEEVTDSLRRLDPEDPTRYDFAITRLGILGICRGGRLEPRCGSCPLSGSCIYG